MNFYTSDLHIGHERIIELDNRPFKNLTEMHETIVEKWNRKVRKSDHVYILGDFAFSIDDFIMYANLLRGTLHFIPGNHDPKSIQRKLIKGAVFHDLIHNINDNNRKVVLCHYPIREWHGFYKGSVHFHGHTHGSIGKSFQPNAYEVGINVHNFEPMSYDELVTVPLFNYRDRNTNIINNSIQ